SDKVAAIARNAEIDVVSSHEIGRNSLRDEDQLRWAANEDRCLVTRNYKHFAPLTIRFLEREWPHRGVLIVPRSLPNQDFAAIARAIVAYAHAHESGLASYTLDFVTRQ